MIFSGQQFLIYLALWILGGGLVFWVYYLLYKRTLKKKGSIQSTSLVVKAPLIISCINVGLTFALSLYLMRYINVILLFYIVIALSIPIGSIAISIVFYKKKTDNKQVVLARSFYKYHLYHLTSHVLLYTV